MPEWVEEAVLMEITGHNIWATLSAINVNDHTEKKGNFTYLAWTWAWATVKQHYPTATYSLLDDMVFPDGSREVRVEVHIGPLSHIMWLPVLDHKNNAIKNPDAHQINTSRMRCLVKCLAMFGLGHYIYSGESLPQEPHASEEEWQQLVRLVAAKDAMGLRVFADAVGEGKITALFNRAEKGKKSAFKSEVRELYRHSRTLINAMAEALSDGIKNDDEQSVREIAAEISKEEWHYVLAAMPETDVSLLRDFAQHYALSEVPSGI